MLTVSREKRFLKEIVVKQGPQYKQYCRESLRELVMYTCPGIGSREGFQNLTPCGVYEEAREVGEVGMFGIGGKPGIGFGEDGEEWDESVNGFGCDFYEECCGEGCVYGEIGQEECF